MTKRVNVAPVGYPTLMSSIETPLPELTQLSDSVGEIGGDLIQQRAGVNRVLFDLLSRCA